MNEDIPTPPVKKRPGVRRLASSTDARKLQAKLLKQFLAGDLDESTFKASTYGLGQFINIIKVESAL